MMAAFLARLLLRRENEHTNPHVAGFAFHTSTQKKHEETRKVKEAKKCTRLCYCVHC
jgi:phosphotransacetylase